MGPVVNFVDQARPLVSALGPRNLPSGVVDAAEGHPAHQRGARSPRRRPSWRQPQDDHREGAGHRRDVRRLRQRLAGRIIDWTQPRIMDIIIERPRRPVRDRDRGRHRRRARWPPPPPGRPGSAPPRPPRRSRPRSGLPRPPCTPPPQGARPRHRRRRPEHARPDRPAVRRRSTRRTRSRPGSPPATSAPAPSAPISGIPIYVSPQITAGNDARAVDRRRRGVRGPRSAPSRSSSRPCSVCRSPTPATSRRSSMTPAGIIKITSA